MRPGPFKYLPLMVILVAALGPNTNETNAGVVTVGDKDGGGIARAALVAYNNKGYVYADIKSFRVPHPSQADKDIVYASIEGPEAAAYVRGKGHLTNGQGRISLPEHFAIIANPQTMTYMLHRWLPIPRVLQLLPSGLMEWSSRNSTAEPAATTSIGRYGRCAKAMRTIKSCALAAR